MDQVSILVISLVVAAIVIVFMGVKTVPQGQAYTVERFGREILAAAPEYTPAVSALEEMFASGVKPLEVGEVLEPLYRMQGNWDQLLNVQEVQVDVAVGLVPRELDLEHARGRRLDRHGAARRFALVIGDAELQLEGPRRVEEERSARPRRGRRSGRRTDGAGGNRPE